MAKRPVHARINVPPSYCRGRPLSAGPAPETEPGRGEQKKVSVSSFQAMFLHDFGAENPACVRRGGGVREKEAKALDLTLLWHLEGCLFLFGRRLEVMREG